MLGSNRMLWATLLVVVAAAAGRSPARAQAPRRVAAVMTLVVLEGPWVGTRLFARGENLRVPPALNPVTNADGRVVAPMDEARFTGTIAGVDAGSPLVINQALLESEASAAVAIAGLADAVMLNARALRRVEAAGRGDARADLAGAVTALEAVAAANDAAAATGEVAAAEAGQVRLAVESAQADTRAALRYLNQPRPQRREALRLIQACLARTQEACAAGFAVFVPRLFAR
jgi:hypothetical protein